MNILLPDLCRLRELNSMGHSPRCYVHDVPPNVQNISGNQAMLQLQGNQAYERSLQRLRPPKPTIPAYEVIPPLPGKGAFELETFEEQEEQEHKSTIL